MEILPLLIFLGGIIYTAITSQKDKSKNQERNIDPSKMERPTSKSAPRRRQPNTPDESKGMFGDLMGEIERRMGNGEDSKTQPVRQEQPIGQSSRPASTRGERQPRERRSSERTSSERTSSRTMEDKVKNTRAGRQAQNLEREVRNTDWAERVKEESQSRMGQSRSRNAPIEVGKPEAGTERSTAGKKEKPKLKKNGLTFEAQDVVNGVIFSEILGKPKSKK
ncbi:hypothetical protein ACFPFV_11870 [Salinicoccus siamensis]|uniref:Uncharacterized protein n=1 Tax=Salinicoccus siamensis TaxID=381830 RepID=A0ABV5Z3N6_9STAP